MDVLNALDHLICKHEDRLEREFPLALAEQFFETGAERVHHHDIALFVLSEPVHGRDTDTVVQDLVDFLLIQQLRL